MDCCPCLSVGGSAAYSFASQSEEAHRKGHSLLEIAETEMLSITSHHGPRTFAGVLLIMILCVADSYLTIDLVSRGAEELNPIMAYYLNQSPLLFFIVKYSITCHSDHDDTCYWGQLPLGNKNTSCVFVGIFLYCLSVSGTVAVDSHPHCG